MPSYWLLKTEPGTYSFQQLLKDRKTNWNDVRNFQARNSLRQMAKGDVALIYHSGDDKAVVGWAEVVREAYADPDPEDPKGDWVQVDLKPGKALPRAISLAEIKKTAALADLPLIRQSRLSVMPVTPTHYRTILKLSEVTDDA
jgi:predicted RNA-binding protein with PUA-like domain